MKVMHAWHQQIEPVAHAALASTAAAMERVVAMTRTTSTMGRHAVRWRREQGTSVCAAAQSM